MTYDLNPIINGLGPLLVSVAAFISFYIKQHQEVKDLKKKQDLNTGMLNVIQVQLDGRLSELIDALKAKGAVDVELAKQQSINSITESDKFQLSFDEKGIILAKRKQIEDEKKK